MLCYPPHCTYQKYIKGYVDLFLTYHETSPQDNPIVGIIRAFPSDFTSLPRGLPKDFLDNLLLLDQESADDKARTQLPRLGPP